MTDNTDFLKFAERIINAAAERVGNADEHDLSHFNKLRVKLDDAIKAAIQEQIKQGKSWNDIGNALGISKQAAFKRYK